MTFEPIIIDLKKTLTHGDAVIEKLTFAREPVARDFKGMDMTSLTPDGMLAVAARVLGYPPRVLDELCVADMMRVIGVVSGFLADSLPTGPTS